MMKNGSFIFSKVLGILLFVLTSALPTLAQVKEHFRVGAILPLTGPLAEYGVAAQNGIELAKSEHPEMFRGVEILYEDSQYDAVKSITALNTLRNQKAVSLIYNWGNPTSEAIVPLAEQYKLPLLALTLDPKPFIGKKYAIRSTSPARQFSTKLANYLRKTGFKKIGVVLAENSYVQTLYEGLRLELGDSVDMQVIDTHLLSVQDFRTTILKIRSGHYDAIGVFLISGQVSSFYRQMEEQKIKLPTFGTDFFESSTEIKLAHGGMEGAIYPHLSLTEDFRKRYLERFKSDSQIAYAGNGYDVAVLIATLFGKSDGKLSAESIMDALKQGGEHQGVSGDFRYKDTEDGGPYFEFPVHLKKIENNKVVDLLD